MIQFIFSRYGLTMLAMIALYMVGCFRINMKYRTRDRRYGLELYKMTGDGEYKPVSRIKYVRLSTAYIVLLLLDNPTLCESVQYPETRLAMSRITYQLAIVAEYEDDLARALNIPERQKNE